MHGDRRRNGPCHSPSTQSLVHLHIQFLFIDAHGKANRHQSRDPIQVTAGGWMTSARTVNVSGSARSGAGAS
jgi:hypothetical protein